MPTRRKPRLSITWRCGGEWSQLRTIETASPRGSCCTSQPTTSPTLLPRPAAAITRLAHAPCPIAPARTIERDQPADAPFRRPSMRTAGRWWRARTRFSSFSIALRNSSRAADAAAGRVSDVSTHTNASRAPRSRRSAVFQEGGNAFDQIGAVEPGPVPRVLDVHDLTLWQLRGIRVRETRRDVRVERAPNYQRRRVTG